MDKKNYSEIFEISLGSSPIGFDMAIVSTDYSGTLEDLNKFVLSDYGYSLNVTARLDLEKGFHLFELEGKRPVLFIVTIGDSTTNLTTNLKNALTFHFDFLKNKNIWISLMGTGHGKLNLKTSYDTISNVLFDLKEFFLDFNCFFTISIPNTKEGQIVYNTIKVDSIVEKIVYTHVIGKELASKLISDSEANFYLVGSNWGHAGDQSEKFYEKQIWENGYDDGSYSEIVNGVKVNDILINKSTFATKKKENFLRFKAIGLVTKNLNNGRQLKVKWIYILKEASDIKGLSFYRDTITIPSQADLITILSEISSQDFENVHYNIVHQKMYEIADEKTSAMKLSETNITTLAGLISDAETGTDYLDITKDVNAFARVMAAKSFEPPLAIALLGKWGSGKSFFMHKLKNNIQNLSSINPEKQFCQGIAHVHFNAWSYMDANLWASIITRIFEGLDEYINGLNLSEKEKKEIEEQLFQKLTISKEEHNELENQKSQIKKRIHELRTHKKHILKELKDKVSSIRQNSLKEILKKVNDDFQVKTQIEKTLNENPTFVNSTQKFEKIVPRQYWENPNIFYNELKSIYTFFQSFFRRENIWTNLFWIILLAFILSIPFLLSLITTLMSWQDFTIPKKTWTLITFIGMFFTRSVDTYMKLKKQIAPFWNLKEKYEKEKEEAIFKSEQEEKALNLEIEQKKEEIIQINNEINTSVQLHANLEFKLKNVLSTHALYSFIEKRANSDDYKKHLGIVSLIRKDFEILSGLLTNHKTELVTYKDSEEFKELFKGKKSLERIILYIDDLDRCPEERVVEVLEAVNLLMAFPLFVVVVGVDPRWVKKALHVKYKNQFSEEAENQDAISPSNYLEKIFQVPFHLKDAEEISIKNMIKTLAQVKPNIIVKRDEEEFVVTNIEIKKNGDNDKDIAMTYEIEKIQQKNNNKLLRKETVEALDITERECELLQNMSEVIGNNPRAIKRFVNIYRIIKTHEDFVFDTKNKETELLAVMFLLALSIGTFKDLQKSFEGFLNQNIEEQTTIRGYFRIKNPDSEKDSNHENKKQKLKSLLFLKNNNLLSIDNKIFRNHYDFIKRFTFKNI
jgi:hypothetical protein